MSEAVDFSANVAISPVVVVLAVRVPIIVQRRFVVDGESSAAELQLVR